MHELNLYTCLTGMLISSKYLHWLTRLWFFFLTLYVWIVYSQPISYFHFFISILVRKNKIYGRNWYNWIQSLTIIFLGFSFFFITLVFCDAVLFVNALLLFEFTRCEILAHYVPQHELFAVFWKTFNLVTLSLAVVSLSRKYCARSCLQVHKWKNN